jgi:formiminotetrahydrofolate cyclodeaminase
MKRKDAEYQLQQINLKLIKCKEFVADTEVDNELLAEDMVEVNDEIVGG